MKNIFRIIIIAVVTLAMTSCNKELDPKDFDGRIEKLSKKIEKLDTNSCEKIAEVLTDVYTLYLDVIEDVYNTGKDSSIYDFERIIEIQEGIIAEFNDKCEEIDTTFLDIECNQIITEAMDKIMPRMEQIAPYMGEMLGYNDEQYNEDYEDLGDGYYVVGEDTLHLLEDGRIVYQGDTLTEDEYVDLMYQKGQQQEYYEE